MATIDIGELIPLDVYHSINGSLELTCLLEEHREQLAEVTHYNCVHFWLFPHYSTSVSVQDLCFFFFSRLYSIKCVYKIRALIIAHFAEKYANKELPYFPFGVMLTVCALEIFAFE